MHFLIKHIARVEAQEPLRELLEAVLICSVKVRAPECEKLVSVEKILSIKILQESIDPPLSLAVLVMDAGHHVDF